MNEWTRGLAAVADEVRHWVEAIRLALGAEAGHLWALGPDADQLSLYVSTPEGAEDSVPEEIPSVDHALSWVVAEGLTLRASSGDVFLAQDDGWILAVPVSVIGGDRLGCVVLEFAHAPPANASQALEMTAALAGRLVARANVSLEARRDLEKNEALFGALHDLDRGLDLGGLAGGACERARRVAGAQGAILALWNANQHRGQIIALDGAIDQGLLDAEIEGDESFLGLALTNSTPLPRDQLGARDRLPLYLPGMKTSAGSAIIVPLMVDAAREPIGAIAVEFEQPRDFNDADVRRLQALARFVAPSIRNAAEFGAVQAMSLTDALTGLPNRRATERSLASTIAVAERSGGPYAVAVLDVDHFKQFNDNYGHDAGDRVLQVTATVTRDSLRPGDIAGRWGGEEFLIVLPSTELEDAAHVVERIRRSVESSVVTWEGKELSVTVSAGVSAYPEVVRNPGGVVASADAALYRAKRGGRNAVAVAVWPQRA